MCARTPPHGSERNSWAGWPAAEGLAPHLLLRAVVSGPVEERTGFLCNIKLIDKLLCDRAVAQLREAYLDDTRRGSMAGEMAGLWQAVAPYTPQPARLEKLTLFVTPFLRYTVRRGETHMVSVTYSFEFSAAHRLYCADLSDEENQAVFGRCANPNGHGHNYVVQVTLRGQPHPQTGTLMQLDECTRIVNREVIHRFDHKHLNADCAEFASLNPSVENITRVIYDRLEDAFAPVTLHRVRVYETPKTYAQYPAD